MLVPEILNGQRIFLRKLSVNDLDFVYQFASNPEVTKYVAWQAPTCIEDTRQYLRHTENVWARQHEFTWAVVTNTYQTDIGVITIVPDGHAAQIGYVIDPQYANHGYATEAGKLVLDWLFEQPEIMRVWTVCDTEHIASKRVLEKIGMEEEGILRKWKIRPNIDPHIPRDCFCFAKIRS